MKKLQMVTSREKYNLQIKHFTIHTCKTQKVVLIYFIKKWFSLLDHAYKLRNNLPKQVYPCAISLEIKKILVKY